MKWIPSLISQDIQQIREEKVYEELKQELLQRLSGEEKEMFLHFLQITEQEKRRFGRQKYREGAQDVAREILEDLEGCLRIPNERTTDYPKRLI